MKLFRLGYIATVGFLLVLGGVSLVLGFYPAPKGPKAPEPPSYTSLSSYNVGASPNPSQYEQQLQDQQSKEQQYQDQQKQYQNTQKTFVKDQVVPYARNVFVALIILLAIIEALGMLIAVFVSELAGAALAFSGVWAVLFGPIGAFIWFANSLVSSFSHASEQDFSLDPLLQTVGVTCLICVLILLGLGMIFYRNKRQSVTMTSGI